jgi:hypothetical protein
MGRGLAWPAGRPKWPSDSFLRQRSDRESRRLQPKSVIGNPQS